MELKSLSIDEKTGQELIYENNRSENSIDFHQLHPVCKRRRSTLQEIKCGLNMKGLFNSLFKT